MFGSGGFSPDCLEGLRFYRGHPVIPSLQEAIEPAVAERLIRRPLSQLVCKFAGESLHAGV
ncbi:hypothetical protein DPMN_175157 [Dreissena polymorpha]|uniref:Uncharacterized protein n=1 Tax=Dreissena polymorpha TaxID=45954 RepID=A0A9D4E7M7_DREPO|nr:hypothetical protein DPMN_175157 [Dreissena polymorpha]